MARASLNINAVHGYDKEGEIALRSSWVMAVGITSPKGENAQASIVSGGLDNFVSCRALEASVSTDLAGHTGYVSSVAVHPDGTLVASASGDKSIKLWKDSECLQTLKGHSGDVMSIAWSTGGGAPKLASGSCDKSVKLWGGEPGEMDNSKSHAGAHQSDCNAVAWSADSSKLASGGDDCVVCVFDGGGAGSKTELAAPGVDSEKIHLTSLAWAPQGDSVAAGYTDFKVRIWNTVSGSISKTLDMHDGRVTSLLWKQQGLWSGSWDKMVYLWNVEAGKVAVELKAGGGVFGLCASPDGEKLCAAVNTGKILIFQRSPLAIKKEKGLSEAQTAAIFAISLLILVLMVVSRAGADAR